MSAGPAWEDSHLDLQDDDIVLDNPLRVLEKRDKDHQNSHDKY